jgi:hypothetical protein
MIYKEFAKRYQDKGWDEETMKLKYDRMMEELTPYEILQSISMFPESMGAISSPGGSFSGNQEYTPGSGWAQWNNEPWSTLETPWSELI